MSERWLTKAFTAEIAETDRGDRGEKHRALGWHHGVSWLTGRPCIKPGTTRTNAHSIISERWLTRAFTAETAETDRRDR